MDIDPEHDYRHPSLEHDHCDDDLEGRTIGPEPGVVWDWKGEGFASTTPAEPIKWSHAPTWRARPLRAGESLAAEQTWVCPTCGVRCRYYPV